MSAKGVSWFAQTSLKHGVYKRVLLSGHHMRSNISIGSSKHLLQTIRNNKIPLSAFDDKRFIQNDGILCLLVGNFEIRNWQLHREILEEDDWGDEEQEKPQKLVQLGLLLSGTSQFPLVAMIRRFQTMMLTVNEATMKLKQKFQMRYSFLLTLEFINEITPKVNWKKSLISMNKQWHIQLLDKETLSLRTELKKNPFEILIQTKTMRQSTTVP